ncbi:hypothetical protein NGM10_07535 [Halorussus salilacus]|uniref:hypothetical protein n=1 Tax=Halorussus salilacus TaxID=2953750 RepID=UPI0020A1F0C7|nr:hypothetical protein [Halorussus salilacus]USZ69574.1 hypothetical protein NGM10_07535 [Halorussus salilacus]
MKRREMLLATATISLAGVPGLSSADTDATAQTDPITLEDATLELGGVSLYIGSASFYYDEGAAVFEGREWVFSNGSREVALSGAVVAVENVSAETFAAVRDAMAASYDERSLSPLLSGLAAAEVDPSTPMGVRIGTVSTDTGTLVEEVTATGTVGDVTPANWAAFATGEEVELGAAQFDTVALQRGGVVVTAEEVVAEPFSNGLSVTSDGGTIEGSGGTLTFENLNTTFRPPEEGGEPHRAAFERMRRLAAKGALTLDAVGTTMADSGVTVANTVEAMRNTRYEATMESVTRDGESVVEDFGSSGTLAELVQMLRQSA